MSSISQNGSTIGSITDFNMYFGALDHVIFAAMLVLSTLIGVYYGFISKKKQDNTNEYLYGGKQMHTLPISASLIASNVSGITLLGVPSEIYGNGTQYWMFIIPACFVALGLIYIILPVFNDTKVSSSFEYLGRRFGKNVRVLTSGIYTFSGIIFIPIVIYVPALALAQVTGLNLHLITAVLSVVCIFYTTVGGLKAVVWTDTLQFVLMIGASFALIYKGLQVTGGYCNAWDINDRGGRLIFFDMNPSPFVRTSFWAVCFGLSVIWVSNLGVNQSCVQRFLAVPDIQHAKKSVMVYTAGLILVKVCSCVTGLLIYARYYDCDPISIGAVQKLDQILPYYVMDVGGAITGLPGLFIAGIFSAALSTMSSVLNTLSGTIYDDFLRERLPGKTEKEISNIMKLIVVILGVIILGLVFVIEKMGAVFHLAVSLNGITAGTLLGIFTAGIFFRRVNAIGVISGAVVSTLSLLALIIGSYMGPKRKQINLVVRTDGCPNELLDRYNYTTTTTTTTTTTPLPSTTPAATEQDEGFLLFKISFMYYGFLGLIILLSVAYLVSLCVGEVPDIDECMLAPFVRSKEYKKKQKQQKELKYTAVELNDLKISKDETIKS